MANIPVPGPETASGVAPELPSRGLVGACGRTTPLQAVQACGPGHTLPVPGLAPLCRVTAGHGPRQVPHPLLSIQRLDQRHTPVRTNRTLGAWLPRWHRGRLTVQRRFRSPRAPDLPQQRAAWRAFLLAYALRQAADGPPPVEAAWRDVEHQTPQAVHGLERDGVQAGAARGVRRATGHQAVLQGQEAVVRERHPRRGAGQGREDRLGGPERCWGVAPPCLGAPRREAMLPGWGLEAGPTPTRPGPWARRGGLRKAREVEAPEAAREDTDGEEAMGPTRDPTRALRRPAPRGEAPMQVGVRGQWLAPGVEAGEAADLGSARLGGPGDIVERLGDRAQAPPREEARGLERQRPEGMGQGKAPRAVGGLAELPLSGGEPCRLGRAVPCGTAAVAAGVRRLRFGPTGVARGERSAQRGRATQRAGAPSPGWRARQGRSRACAEGGARLAHHVGAFEGGPTHGSGSRSAGKARASRGRAVAGSAGGATWR
jgi:hypothetical protein